MGEPRGARPSDEDVRLLFFRSGGERFSLDVAFVREIIPRQDVTPVPFVPPTVAGIINHRGAIYTLVRFSRLAGLVGEHEESFVLLRLPEMAVGITVEAIEGIQGVSGHLLNTVTEGAHPPAVPFLRRATDPTGRLVHAIDPELLIDTIYRLPELARGGESAGCEP